jgi:hypothetical protein
MAVILNPQLDSIILKSPSHEPYGEAKSNDYQLPQKQQQQQQQEVYQKDTNTYDNNAYTDNNSYNRNYDDYNSHYPGKPNYDSLKTEGTFFVSDAGESHDGFGFTAEYKTEFDVEN